MQVSVGSGVDVAKDTTVNLPAKDTRLSCFDTQPRAESFKAGVFQQLHCCQKKASSSLYTSHLEVQSSVKVSNGNYLLGPVGNSVNFIIKTLLFAKLKLQTLTPSSFILPQFSYSSIAGGGSTLSSTRTTSYSCPIRSEVLNCCHPQS